MRDFPGSPVAETLYSTAAGTSSIPDCGNWDPVSPEAQPKKKGGSLGALGIFWLAVQMSLVMALGVPVN